MVGEQPTLRGEDQHREVDMFCPLHEDKNRSATLNLDEGVWWCGAGCGGGRVEELIQMQQHWYKPPSDKRRNGSAKRSSNGNGSKPAEEITDAKVKGWMQALISSPGHLERLISERGLEPETLTEYEIGWDSTRKAYTIPVRGGDESLQNLRRYNPDPQEGRRKIWGVAGRNTPRLFPMRVFDEDPKEIIICEGEWDALLTIQYGFPAVTRTASANTWHAEWGEYFQGRKVYVCHDMDKAGQDANRKVAKALRNVAAEVRVVKLPYTVKEKHGKDLTDYWLEGHSPTDFRGLIERSEPLGAETDEPDPDSIDIEDVGVLDTFDADRVGQPVRVKVTIKGKRGQGYSVPKRFDLTCTRDKGAMCKICPMMAAGGEDTLDVKPNDPVVLKLMEASESQVHTIASDLYGVPGKCNRLDVGASEHQSVEILFARPSIEDSEAMEADDEGAYANMKITSVGRHNTMPNNTVRAVGALYPDPRTQMNEFLAWDVAPIKTSLDTFEVGEATGKALRKFQTRKGQRPLHKLGEIAKDLEAHVTKIYGRREMHAAMDLIFHSVLSFKFGGQVVERGWLDGLFVGDTRTGKSETATRLVRHYRAGEVVTCESASFAGVIGGLQQHGSKEWSISWGVVPINDRRLVVLDEVSGLHPEEIASMSDVRSRGIAKITKIQTEATRARTRLIWVGNPRDGEMGQYTYGVQAIRPLIGNPEDVARFDLAMTASMTDVAADVINQEDHEHGTQQYPSDLCALMVRWVWSRTAEDVVWQEGAEKAVYAAANDLGRRYVEDPPLIQAANVRIKVARIAVALAARTFSTDASYQKIVVRRAHVEDAVTFIDRIYNMPGFGYGERSREIIADRQEAGTKKAKISQYLRGMPGLAKFLRTNPTFRRQDMEEFLNMDREQANGVINALWEARMVKREKMDIKIEPVLNELLREVRS